VPKIDRFLADWATRPKMNEQQDFDLQSLAEYLHVTPAQVQRMADRGRLPGRKIGGQWRFSRADIHHWLERQIGTGDPKELRGVEQVLQRQESSSTEPIRIVQWMAAELVAIPLEARTRNSAIDSICALAANSGRLWDSAAMADAIRNRESLHPTALENGVALLHPRRPMPNIISDSFIALGIVPRGIPFGGPRGVLSDIFFLIASYDERTHLRILARLSRLVIDPSFAPSLRLCQSPGEALALIDSAEAKVL
jgi:PTS system nitrogen regulatory IIA component